MTHNNPAPSPFERRLMYKHNLPAHLARTLHELRGGTTDGFER